MKKGLKPAAPDPAAPDAPGAAPPDDGLPSIEDILDSSAWEDRLAKARRLRADALAKREAAKAEDNGDAGGMVSRPRIGATPRDRADAEDDPAPDEIESIEDILHTPNLNDRFEKARIRHSQIQALKRKARTAAGAWVPGKNPAKPGKSVLFALGGARGPAPQSAPPRPAAPDAAPVGAPVVAPVLAPGTAAEKTARVAPETAPKAGVGRVEKRRLLTPIRIVAALVFALLVAVAVPGPVRDFTGTLIGDLSAGLPPQIGANVPAQPVRQDLPSAPSGENRQATAPEPTPTPTPNPATTAGLAPSPTLPQTSPQTSPETATPPPNPTSLRVPAPIPAPPLLPAAPLVMTLAARSVDLPPALVALPAPRAPQAGSNPAVVRQLPTLGAPPAAGALPYAETSTPAFQPSREPVVRASSGHVAAMILSQDMAPRVAVLRPGATAPFVISRTVSSATAPRPGAPAQAQAPAPDQGASTVAILAAPPTLSTGLARGVQGAPTPPGARPDLPGLPTALARPLMPAPLAAIEVPAPGAALPFVELPPARRQPATPQAAGAQTPDTAFWPLASLVVMRTQPPIAPAPAVGIPTVGAPATGAPAAGAPVTGAAIAGPPTRSVLPALVEGGLASGLDLAALDRQPSNPTFGAVPIAFSGPPSVHRQSAPSLPAGEVPGVVLASFAPLPGTVAEVDPVLRSRPPSTVIEPLITPGNATASARENGQTAAQQARFQVHVNAPRGVSQGRLDTIIAELKATGYPIGTANRVGFLIRQSNVRYFYRADLSAAVDLAAVVGARARDFTGYSPKPPRGTIEIWLAGSPAAPTARRADQSQAPAAAKDPAQDPAQDPALMALRNRLINSLRRGDILQQPGQ